MLVHRKQKEICPFFDRLHIILRGSLSTDTLPPRQTGSPPRQTDSPPRQTGSKQKEVAISNSSDEQSSDLVRDNTFETAFFTGTTPLLVLDYSTLLEANALIHSFYSFYFAVL